MTDDTKKKLPELSESAVAKLLEVLTGGQPRSPFIQDPEMTAHLLAVLVAQHEGRVTFTQADIDKVDGYTMALEFSPSGHALTVVVTPPPAPEKVDA